MINRINVKNFYSIDSKGRVLLPKDLRDHHRLEPGEILICVPSGTNAVYLEVRTQSQWERYRSNLRRSQPGESKRDAFRLMDVSKDTTTLDGQGRILIPQWIRDACAMRKKVAVIDLEDYFEVWASEYIEQRYADMLRAFKERNDELY